MSKSTGRQRKRNNQVLQTRESKLQEQKENALVDQLDFEIECPRCKDVMELFSEFGYMSYYCSDCHLELNIH
jgi:DNA-directed RNA polymerase subunit RPC12/RpoP